MYSAVVIQLIRNISKRKKFNHRRFAAVFTGVPVRFLGIFAVKKIAFIFRNLVTSYFVS
jgi:hypothetical protein